MLFVGTYACILLRIRKVCTIYLTCTSAASPRWPLSSRPLPPLLACAHAGFHQSRTGECGPCTTAPGFPPQQ